MKLSKAIKELETYNSATFETRFLTFSEARQLGIEALKRLEDTRSYRLDLIVGPLPGETPE